MPTLFPGANDVFNVPSTPTTTKLGNKGDSDRTHTQNHRDLGDALVAMQAEATLKIHTHDSATFRHGNKLAQANTHQSPDTDSGTTSLHHTIGVGANQYASGTHTHPAVATYPLGAFFFAWVSTYPGVTDPVLLTPGLGLVGTWTAVGQRFLCASGGGLGFALGTTGGSNSHSHTIDANTNAASAHSHTLSSNATDFVSDHTHGTNGSTSTGVTHYHPTSTVGSQTSRFLGDSGSSPIATHSHNSWNSTPSHSHSTPTTGAAGGHSHTLTSTATSNSSTHTHTNSTPASANNLLPLFVVYMWKRTA
jgi:hypothetical protein